MTSQQLIILLNEFIIKLDKINIINILKGTEARMALRALRGELRRRSV
jgi:hypothetical protein